jgi:hypothetical protein
VLADLILLVEHSIPDSRIGIPKCGKCLDYSCPSTFQSDLTSSTGKFTQGRGDVKGYSNRFLFFRTLD